MDEYFAVDPNGVPIAQTQQPGTEQGTNQPPPQQPAPPEEPPDTPPPREPHIPEAPAGDVLSVLKTGDPDKFIVRTELKDDKGNSSGYFQTIMSKQETKKRGGVIPGEDEQYTQRYKGSALMGFDNTKTGQLAGATEKDRQLTPAYGGKKDTPDDEPPDDLKKPAETPQDFNQKWSKHLDGDKFTGTEKEFDLYKRDFDSIYQKLPDGSYLTRDSLKDIKDKSPDLYKVLVNEGYDNYIRAINAQNFVSNQEAAREQRLVARSEQEFRAELRKIDPGLLNLYDKGGYDAVQAEFDRREQQWISSLPPKYQTIVREKGADAAIAAMDADILKQNMALKHLDKYKTPDGEYDLSAFLTDRKKLVYIGKGGVTTGSKTYLSDRAKETILREAGFDPAGIQTLIDESKLGIGKQVWRGMTPWDESKGERATPKGISIMAAEVLVPGVYVKRHWSELSPGERAAYIAIDALSLIPLAGAAARGASFVSVTGKASTAARLGGAGRGLAMEAAAQLRAPIDIIIRPIGTAKTSVRTLADLIENIADPRKIPEFSVSNSYHTLKLRRADVTTPAEAKAFTDLLIETAAASKDKRIVLQVGDQVLEMQKSPLMRETGGVASGNPFGENLHVDNIKVGQLDANGIFISPTPNPRFSHATSTGAMGREHAFIITSPETAKKMVSSGKWYKGTAEVEGILPPGTEIPIKQRLYTRLGPMGEYTELLLEKPLSLRQIAKLKVEGLAELVKQPFTPAIKISDKGKLAAVLEDAGSKRLSAAKLSKLKKGGLSAERITGLTEKQTQKLAAVLEDAGSPYQAANLRKAYRIAASQRAAAPQLSRVLGRVSRRELEAARARIREQAGIRRATVRVSAPERLSRVTRSDRAGQPARAQRTERTERPDRPERSGRAERGERIERAERITRLESPERTSRAERAERGKRPPDVPERATPPERPPERAGRPERPDRLPRSPERPERAPRPPTPPAGGAGKRPWTAEDLESAVAWKDGFVVHALRSPYRRSVDEETFSLENVPPGLAYIDMKGAGSQQASVKVTGMLPKRLSVDVGNQDVIITRQQGNRATIRHQLDVSGSRSQLTVRRQGANISRKRGRMYYTKAGGGTLVSRRPLRGS